MNGELLTKITIWLALCGYGLGAACLLKARQRPHFVRIARAAWTAGCLIYLVHVVCAFHFYHHWSHTAALLDTASQTKETVGAEFGEGVFVSYAFTLGWLVDMTWWWLSGLQSYLLRPRFFQILWQSFLGFIFFNGTVVFASGPIRWFGLALFVGLGALWCRVATSRFHQRSHSI
jgi:hypothetical protein